MKQMKKALLFFFAALTFLACGGGDDGGGGSGGSTTSEYLNVADINIDGGNTTATLSIQASNNCQWVISWNDAWIRSISPTTGRGNQNVTVTVDVNPSSTASRTAVVTVKNTSGTITRNITLTQSPNVEKLELSVQTLNFTNSAGSQDITITSNTHWTISGVTNWITLSKTEGNNNGTVTITVNANTTESVRNAVLTVSGSNGISKQLTVNQTGRSTEFSVTPSNFSVDALACVVSFDIVGEARWTVQSNQDWARLSDVSGEGSKTISITIQNNTNEQERTAEITVSSTSKTEKIVIRQSAGSKPSISDVLCTDIFQTGATISFKYQSLFPVTEYGVCYSSTNANPSMSSDKHISQSGSSKQGEPSFTLTGLNAGTTYYIRVFATSAAGTHYSNTITFSTPKNWPGGGDNETPNI